MLLVGPGRAASQSRRDLDLAGLKPDGIVIESRGENLLLAGDRPRGTLYAVYTFLEDAVGCRWWSSKVSTHPAACPTSPCPSSTSATCRRWSTARPSGSTPSTATGRRATSPTATRAAGRDRAAARSRYGGPFFVHTFAAAGAAREVLQGRIPSGSAKSAASGCDGYAQLCVTNEEVKTAHHRPGAGAPAGEPRARTSSPSRRTTATTTACAPNCKKLEEEEGSPAGPLLHLVNYVAAAVAKEYPERGDRHAGVPVHPQAAAARQAAAERHRPAVQHRVRLRAAADGARATASSPTTSAAGRRSAIGCTSGTTPPTSATTSSRTRTCACWAPTSVSSWTTASRASSSRAPTRRSGAEFAELQGLGAGQGAVEPAAGRPTSWSAEFVHGYYGPAAPIFAVHPA